MHNLLINEPPLQILPTLAEKIGLKEAIFLQQLHYWTQHCDHDGWVFNSAEAWHRQFPFWSTRTVERIVQSLRKQGLVEVQQRASADRVNFYRVDYEALGALAVA
jgi:hypothetical protein